MTAPRTLFDKVWDAHAVLTREDGSSLIWIDRHFVHEGSHHAFAKLGERGASVTRPDLTFGVADHYVPTRGRSEPIADKGVRRMIDLLESNAAAWGIRLFGLRDPHQGIVHVVGPEQGLTLPGLTIVCGDSHTSTQGACGSIAFGIGASDVAHVLATQTLWQRRPKRMRITVEGATAPGIGAKDIALSIVARLGADGAAGYAVEYAGSTIRALSMEGRLTLCNLAIESGARCGMVAPDEVTFRYLQDRPFTPRGGAFETAVAAWSALPSDPEASFDCEVGLDGTEIESAGGPQGTSAGPGLAGLLPRQASGRVRGSGQDIRRGRARLGRVRLLDVRRHERRPPRSGRAGRLDHEPQF